MSITTKCVDTVRVLSAEAIERAKSGHPGICLGAAPIGFEVFADFLNFNCDNPEWDNRDRFVLSAGHGSMLLYSLLHMFGYDITKEDLMNFRQLGSVTPGHPEYGKTPGVETTTGPLAQGLGNAVGFALAEAHLASIFNRPGYPVVDHYTYVLCGEGCLEEGLGYEACSFAGTQKLGKLILLYDRNNVTIEGDIGGCFTDNIQTRFTSQGWQVLLVPDATDLSVLETAIASAKNDLSRPSIIICNTTIGHGCPIEGTGAVHGAPIGEENLTKLKEKLNWTEEPFEVPWDVKEYCRTISESRREVAEHWNRMFAEYERKFPELAEKYKRYMNGYVLNFNALADRLDFSSPEATRVSGGKILNEIAKEMPNLLSGSADLAPSTKTEIKDGGYFSPENRTGRNIQFGVREHAMAAICNGIQLHGGLRIVCSTFFVFSDYMKAGIRMSGLLDIPVIYVMTHDSIGVGEDGPTHQPMEQLIALRAIPKVKVFRPCDGKETVAAYVSALAGQSPTVIVLTRQNLNQLRNTGLKALAGGYVIDDCGGKPDVILIGTGSEVNICIEAKAILENEGISTRVVSMCCMEEFENQTEEYKQTVLPTELKARVCIEAASHYSWYKYAGDFGEIIAMQNFGCSAPAKVLFEHYGFTVENTVEKAKTSIENYRAEVNRKY